MAIVADQDADTAKAVAGEINEAKGRALSMAVDVREQRQVEAMVHAAVEHFGGLHILVNSAGVGEQTAFLKQTIEGFERPKSMTIGSMADLAGKKVATSRGTGMDTQLTREAKGADLVRYEDDATLITAAVTGQEDIIGGTGRTWRRSSRKARTGRWSGNS